MIKYDMTPRVDVTKAQSKIVRMTFRSPPQKQKIKPISTLPIGTKVSNIQSLTERTLTNKNPNL